MLGLLRPSELLLLYEITTDLDILARQDLLEFLRQESEQHNTSILYATHIFDRLDQWATELASVRDGRISLHCPLSEIQDLQEITARGDTAPLFSLVEGWLKRDAGR